MMQGMFAIMEVIFAMMEGSVGAQDPQQGLQEGLYGNFRLIVASLGPWLSAKMLILPRENATFEVCLLLVLLLHS